MNPSETICWTSKRQPAESLSPLLPQEERITSPLHHPFRQKTPPTSNTTAEIIQRAPSPKIHRFAQHSFKGYIAGCVTDLSQNRAKSSHVARKSGHVFRQNGMFLTLRKKPLLLLPSSLEKDSHTSPALLLQSHLPFRVAPLCVQKVAPASSRASHEKESGSICSTSIVRYTGRFS